MKPTIPNVAVILVALFFFFGFPLNSIGQELEIESGKSSIPMGKITTLKISSEGEIGQVRWTGNTEAFETIEIVEVSTNHLTIALKPKSIDTGFLSFSSDKIPTPKKFDFTITPTIQAITLGPNVLSGQPVQVVQDKTVNVAITSTDGSEIPDDLIQLKIEPPDSALANFEGGELKITGRVPKEHAIVRVLSEGRELAAIKVDVKEAVSQIIVPPGSIISLPQNGPEKQLSELGVSFLGKQGSTLTPTAAAASCIVDKPEIVKVDADCEKVTPGKSADEALLTVKVAERDRVIRIVVTPVPGNIKLSSMFGSNLDLSYPNNNLSIQATVLDSEGKEIEVNPPRVKWFIPEADDRELIRISEKPGNRVDVYANKAISGSEDQRVTLRACLLTVDDTQATAAGVPVGCSEVTALVRRPYKITSIQPLRIRLDMLDRQTAQDLFGKRAMEEYFIAKVRLFNEIGRQDEDFGNSILVYGESLEVKVGVEYRYKGEKKEDWKRLEKNGNERNDWFENLPITNIDRFSDDKNGKKKCNVIEQTDMFVPYRPLTFEMVLNTQDRRDNRSTRSIVLKTMNGLSSLASFVTAIAVPGAGSDLPLGLDKFRNLLIPSFEKLFPSLNEIQRQNITSMVMRPLEEIPFGSDITRVLFFPKKSIEGVLLRSKTNSGGKGRVVEFRISAVSISDACAEAGIIKKTTEVPEL
jgi:hypothetical protein